MMVTTYDDEDIDRAAKALRSRFRFSVDRGNFQFHGAMTVDEQNRRMGEIQRNDALKLSREAAKMQFETMGCTYVPLPAKAA